MSPKAKLGRTVRVTFRLTPDDADRLAASAWERRISQTTIVEEFIRALPEPSAEYLAAKHVIDERTP
jgi:hypothetical protein